MRGSGPRKKPSAQQKRQSDAAQLRWVDSELRFVARLSSGAGEGQGGVVVCLDVRRPTAALASRLGVPAAGGGGHAGGVADDEDDLYLEVGETLRLRPCGPRQDLRAPPAAAASPHEVTVRVEAFWSSHESGGNHGCAVRAGSVAVLGDTAALGRLRGDHAAPQHDEPGGGRVRDASGVHGAAHALVGGISLRRMRRGAAAEAAAAGPGAAVFAAPRWVCVDYTATHARYCPADPRCSSSSRSSSRACASRGGLTLRWQTHNEHDENAIEVLAPPMPDGAAGSRALVGFVPRELAACLSPALRRGSVRVSGVGVYSAPAAAAAADAASTTTTTTNVRYRVWFQVCPAEPGGVVQDGDGAERAAAALDRAPWWVGSP